MMDLFDEDKNFPSCKKKGKIIETVEGFKYPLKIVVTVEDDTITVITNYPLKKGRKNESLLR